MPKGVGRKISRAEANGKSSKNSKKTENSTVKFLPGGRGQQKKTEK